MRINQNRMHETQFDATSSAKRTEAGKGQSADGAIRRQVGLDRVEVSAVAGTANQVLEAAESARSARVNELRAIYQSGGHQVDAGRLADNIIREDSQEPVV
jgi:flagellar biosynthesis anti-sigma factor FlgM